MMMTQTFRDPLCQAQNDSFFASVQGFIEQMQAEGYAAASMKTSTRLVKDFAVWLDQHGIASQSLSAKHVADYLDHRWLQRRGDAFTLEAFARHVAPDEYEGRPEQAIVISPARRVRHEFERYLLCERGLAAASIRLYSDSIGRFLQSAFGATEVRLDQLTAPDVIGFVQTEAARLRHPKRAQVMTMLAPARY
jgi:site-specific recombinase XerD